MSERVPRSTPQPGPNHARNSRSRRSRKMSGPAFTWEDGWIFASLTGGKASSNLVDIVAAADVLNHAIPTAQELRAALRRLHAGGLVTIRARTVGLTPHGLRVYADGIKRRGGLFSVVDNMVKALNLPRHRLPPSPEKANVSFVTAPLIARSHAEYERRLRPAERASQDPRGRRQHSA